MLLLRLHEDATMITFVDPEFTEKIHQNFAVENHFHWGRDDYRVGRVAIKKIRVCFAATKTHEAQENVKKARGYK